MMHATARFALLSLMTGTAVAQVPPVVHVAPPAPMPRILPPVWRPPVPMVLAWQGGTVACNGIAQAAVTPARVDPVIEPRYPQASMPVPITVTFAIDTGGRPHAIATLAETYSGGTSDIVPALAAARFAAGTERTGCTIRFTPSQTTIADAPAETVVAATVFPEGRPPRAAYARGFAADTDCMTPQPDVRLRAFPDFKAIPQAPGTSDWTMVGYDIDRRGRPVGVRTRYSSGNAVLDRAGVTAVGRSRFEPGARKGCGFPYWRRGETLAAPQSPDAIKQPPVGSTCPIELGWVTEPTLRYPPAFARRRIEGWAVVAFDVAPWGQTGNIRVVAAEPAAAFGTAAMDVIRQATKAPSQGYVGCVERVRYVMGTGAE